MERVHQVILNILGTKDVDRIREIMCNKGFYMNQLDWVEESTQSVWNVCIKFDTWNNIENFTVLEETVLRKTIYIEKVIDGAHN